MKNVKPNCQNDEILDSELRPNSFKSYIGQEKIKDNLKIILAAAKKRNEIPDHLLFYGPPGLGKTTLANLIAKETQSRIKMIAGPVIEKSGDIVAILTNLKEGDVLFIDEIHRINHLIEEYLYSAMEDFRLNLILGKGPMAKTIDLHLPKFTLIGATTRIDLLTSPLRGRFGATFQLNFYSEKEIQKIIKRSSLILNTKIEEEAIFEIARRSRFTPRIANNLLKRMRDFAEVKGNGTITYDITKASLDFLEIDELGLEKEDRKIISTIVNKFNGGPVGIQALAAATSEEERAILDIYEPYLMQLNLIQRTPKGRAVTKKALEHLKKCPFEQL
ncbi:MAG: Holliday junction branch migration DNA helicase RuvB [Candidatus Pacebacteria bacterium]|nr:Holliday junction branch migration DNA helicase RuvB [Candidatus Paceibacterota bacterium]MDD4333808.1 Holliday junction branch migration DNA helicase RuvB [Candidatus Paceibacterota bacterium]